MRYLWKISMFTNSQLSDNQVLFWWSAPVHQVPLHLWPWKILHCWNTMAALRLAERDGLLKKNTSDGTILRIFQHTPGTYPRPPTNSLWRSSFHLGLRGCLGYAPGVCWGSLRTMVSWKRWFPCLKMVYIIKGDTIYHGKNRSYPGKGDGIHMYSWWFKLIDVMIDCNMSLPETSSSPMKTDGWKTRLSFGARPILRGYVSFREGSRLDFLFSFEKWEMDSYI